MRRMNHLGHLKCCKHKPSEEEVNERSMKWNERLRACFDCQNLHSNDDLIRALRFMFHVTIVVSK
jgi:hypothetical protein